MEQKNQIERTITRYLNGDFGELEEQELMSWINTSGENKKLFYQIKDVWDSALNKENHTDKALIEFYKKQASAGISLVKNLRLWKTVAGIAAVLAIGFFSVFLLNSMNQNSEITNLHSTFVSYKVPLGSRSEVTLSDGTSVIINSGTELQYPVNFENGKREVILSGEAFFKVKSDKENPFIVKTNNFDVQVTGTQFNVCSYTDDNLTSVILAEGKVDVLFDDNTVVNIVPGQQIELNKESMTYNLKETDIDISLSWKDGEFRFRDITFPDLIKKLERWYDVSLPYSSPELETMIYNGNFKNQETIWQVLDALELTTQIEYKKTGFREFEIIYKPN